MNCCCKPFDLYNNCDLKILHCLKYFKTRINIDTFDHLKIKRKEQELLRYQKQSEKTNNRVKENIFNT